MLRWTASRVVAPAGRLHSCPRRGIAAFRDPPSCLPTPARVVEATPRAVAPYTVGLLRRVPDGVVAQVSESYTEWKQKEEGSVESLHPKPWEASWLSVTFPLARGGPTDPASPALFKLGAVNEQFAMPYGGAGTRHGVRHGRLFELLDAFTGEIAMRHTNHTNPARPLTLVTAGADSMESLSELDATADFTLTGAVTRVGRSSLEVTAEVRQHNSLALTSRFHYVARDATTYGAAEINPLQLDPTTDPEAVARAADAARRAKGRRDRAEASLYHSPPTAAESKLIHTRHSEWVQYADTSSHRVQMPEPLRSVNVMQMDNRNIHGKIFGGYLLRKAYEAAWSSAVELLASKNGSAETVQYMAAVQLSRVSEVHFLLPVEVGNMLDISSRPVYTAPDGTVVVMTDCRVKNHRAASGYTLTNRMIYEFSTAGEHRMPELQPLSYGGMLAWLEGRRHYRDARGLDIDDMDP